MSRLPRPDLPAGAHRDLVDALHDLHHRAGWPSLRTLAKAAGCSPTTVSTVFSMPKLPSWGLLELLVEAMGGDPHEFHRLWLDCGSAQDGTGSAPPTIAGRRSELAAVQRHLESGVGLLLVTGEAGIGKSRLVHTGVALASDANVVLKGSCLPLSSQTPLQVIADVLAAGRAVDGGGWLRQALEGCPPYVEVAIARLLPDLGELARPVPDDVWARGRLLSAVAAITSAMASSRSYAVLVEDLHWADTATLDLLEFLLARPLVVPFVGTLRVDDPDVSSRTLDWALRLQRSPAVSTLRLGTMTRDETAEQLAMLGHPSGDAEWVDRIHRRSAGLPLFVEQLAAHVHGPASEGPPDLLSELLDQRVRGLAGEAARVANALAVADRGLSLDLLSSVTALNDEDMATGLHRLADRWLLRSGTGAIVELRHPLVAEALRRKLVIPESRALHASLAEALASSTDPSASEIAEHWQRAGDRQRELGWRIAAARDAVDRFALAEAGELWRHVLTIWPEELVAAGDPPMSHQAACVAAMDALLTTDLETARRIADSAVAALASPGADSKREAAETLHRAARIRAALGDVSAGLDLVTAALRIHEEIGPSVAFVNALNQQEILLDALGQWRESREAGARALEMCAGLNEPRVLRRLLVVRAGHEADLGDLDRAFVSLAEASGIDVGGPDPEGDVHLAVVHTYVLGLAGAVGEEVARAGAPGLASAAAWGMETAPVLTLRANMVIGLREAGFVARAVELIDDLALDGPPVWENVALHEELALLDMLQGRCPEAVARSARTTAFPALYLADRMESAQGAAEIELWSGLPSQALDRLLSILHEAVSSDASAQTAEAFILAARAAADVAETEGAEERARSETPNRLRRLLAQAGVDPFAPIPAFASRPALKAAWIAELARLTHQSTVHQWTDAAARWDRLHRPHDAAYCRWRGAQEAMANGQGTIAAKLLRRAARDAREHVPLASVIAETATYAPQT